MSGFVLTLDLVIMLLPLIALQVGLAVYCVLKIVKEGVQNLNKWAWAAICIFVNLFGPITFLIVGRKKEFR